MSDGIAQFDLITCATVQPPRRDRGVDSNADGPAQSSGLGSNLLESAAATFPTSPGERRHRRSCLANMAAWNAHANVAFSNLLV